MDFDLLPQLMIIFSIAGILAIVARNFSKVKEATREEIFLKESEKEKQEKEKFLYLYRRAVRRINKENYQKKMADFWVWLEKFLRKLRIVVLKLDTRMSSTVEHLRKKNVKSIENLKEMAEATEKNVRKSKEMEGLSGFLASKGAYKKHRKVQEEVPAIGEEDSNVDIPGMVYPLPIMETPVAKEAAEVEPVAEDTYFSENSPTDENLKNAGIEYIEVEEIALIESEDTADVLAEEMKEEIIPEEVAGAMNEIEKVEEPVEMVAAVEALRADTDETEITESVEEAKIRTKKEQECIEILMKDPTDIKAYWRLGLIYSKRRNYEDALACFRQIIKIDPTYTKAKQKAIELMEKMKKKGK